MMVLVVSVKAEAAECKYCSKVSLSFHGDEKKISSLFKVRGCGHWVLAARIHKKARRMVVTQ